MFWISFTNGLGFKLTSQVQDFSHAEQYGSILWSNHAPNKIFRSTSGNLGVPWTIGRVNRANNGTNQFYVTSNNLKSKRIKTKSISIIKTISEKDSYWIISYFLNNKSFDLCIHFPNLVQFHGSLTLSESSWKKKKPFTNHYIYGSRQIIKPGGWSLLD